MSTPALLNVTVQTEDFDVGALQHSLIKEGANEGAVATFTGYVRAETAIGAIDSLELEHYPQMTERSIATILQQASERWQLMAARVVHRVGKLAVGDQIVWVGVSSKHRADAFSACEFIMDYLKTQAPLWKKESSPQASRWVESCDADQQRAQRWE